MRTLLILIFIVCFGITESFSQTKVLEHGAHRIGNRTDAAMETWRGYGFGQFIHWGLYSILGGQYDGKQYAGAAEWIRAWDQIPNEVYDSLNTEFNPQNFNPQNWAKMAKNMGAKYVTITTKHHDGFCLWPSKYTNYTIANSPYKKDILKPLIDAYNKEGIDVILYFSILDWSSPDWRSDLKTKEDTAAFNRFKKFTENQLFELLDRYPTTKGLWFDGTWDGSWKKNGAYSDSLEIALKNKIPGLVIGSRLRADELGERHFDSNGILMGDYEQGWERKLPKTYEELNGNDWECVMTIPKNGWGYSENWMGHWKTTNEVLEMLVKSVSYGGNFVLNFGPKGDGTFREKEKVIANEIGDWMAINNNAIYSSQHANLEKQDWGYYTKKTGENKVHAVVFNRPISDKILISPSKDFQFTKIYLVGEPNKELTIEMLDDDDFQIDISDLKFSQKPFVFALEY